MVRMEFPDGYIPIRRFLQRSDAPTFADWLQTFYPEDFKNYQRDPVKFKFGENAALTLTYECQRLMDEYDRDCWFKSEKERAYYFSSLLDGVDVAALDEFQLFGSVGGHSAEEMQDFKAELLSMQAAYKKNPGAYFNPTDTADSDSDSTGADSPAAVL
jgi:hypothetical protein